MEFTPVKDIIFGSRQKKNWLTGCVTDSRKTRKKSSKRNVLILFKQKGRGAQTAVSARF